MSKPNFWQELKRRNVYRVGVTYVIAVWLLIQVASILLPAFEAPAWALKLVILVLILGFPVALILAWAFELSPSGIIRTPPTEENNAQRIKDFKKPTVSNLFIGILLLALAGQFVYFKWLAEDRQDPLSKSAIHNSARIAVVPFENLTNDPNEENFGKISANFITLALMDIEDVEVVSPSTVETNLAAFGIRPDDPSKRMSFTELTGANVVIAGSYFIEGKKLTLALQVQDAVTGKVIFAYPELSGNAENKELLIANVTENVLGYWAAKELIDSRRINLPNLEAYGLYLDRGQDNFSYNRLADILALDSTFYLARIEWLNHARWLPHQSKPDHFRFLDRNLTDLTNYERELFDFVKNLYQGNSTRTFNKVYNLWQRFPKDFGLHHDAAGIAYDELNNHRLSVQIYDQLPLNEFEYQTILTTPGRLRNEIVSRTILYGPAALNRTHLADIVNDVKFPSLYGNFISAIYSIMTKDETLYLANLERDLKEAKEPTEQFNLLQSRFEWDYRSTFSTAGMNSHLIQTSRNKLNDYPQGGIHRAIVAQIIRVFDGNPVSYDSVWKGESDPYDPYSPYHRYLYWTALGKIRSGDLESVKPIILELESYVVDDLILAASYAAFPYYHIGCIYAQMGDDTTAIQYLRKARDMGLYAGHYQFNYDRHLESLTANPEFRNIVKPISPQ